MECYDEKLAQNHLSLSMSLTLLIVDSYVNATETALRILGTLSL